KCGCRARGGDQCSREGKRVALLEERWDADPGDCSGVGRSGARNTMKEHGRDDNSHAEAALAAAYRCLSEIRQPLADAALRHDRNSKDERRDCKKRKIAERPENLVGKQG